MGPTRSLVLKILPASAALAAAALLLLDLAAGGSGRCHGPAPAAPLSGLDAAFRELAVPGWVPPGGGRALCVGPDLAGTAAAVRRMGFRSAVTAPAGACCGLPFGTASFDFALAVGLDRARVPARLVLEMERVLRPGRVGVVLRAGPVRPDGLMRAAAPVASLLRFSDVVGARAVNGSAMIVFKKRGSGSGSGSASPASGAACEDDITRMPLVFNEFMEFVRAALVIVDGRMDTWRPV